MAQSGMAANVRSKDPSQITCITIAGNRLQKLRGENLKVWARPTYPQTRYELCPLYPRKLTLVGAIGMSAEGQKQTSPVLNDDVCSSAGDYSLE
jgi:hypothetical protein